MSETGFGTRELRQTVATKVGIHEDGGVGWVECPDRTFIANGGYYPRLRGGTTIIIPVDEAIYEIDLSAVQISKPELDPPLPDSD